MLEVEVKMLIHKIYRDINKNNEKRSKKCPMKLGLITINFIFIRLLRKSQKIRKEIICGQQASFHQH